MHRPQSPGALGATAYTVGSHIVFGDGRYRPGAPGSQALLAHELAHVVQQSRGGNAALVNLGTLESSARRAAETATRPYFAARAVEGRSGVGIFCSDGDPPLAGTPRVKAMTPEDMYNKLIATRGFEESIPVDKLDEVKQQLADMKAQLETTPSPELRRSYNKLLAQYNSSTLEGAGAVMGQGYNTYAIVQVVDKDGNLIAVAEGIAQSDRLTTAR